MLKAKHNKVCLWHGHETRNKIININTSAAILAILPLSVGGIIYLLFRPDTIRFFHWFSVVGLNAPIEFIRSYSTTITPFMPEWIIFSLPNGLWAFSYAFTMAYVWFNRNTIFKYFWLTSIPVVGLGYESLQFMGVLPGTFCYQDLLFCFCGVSLGTFMSLKIVRGPCL